MSAGAAPGCAADQRIGTRIDGNRERIRQGFAGWAVKYRLSRQAIHDLIDLPSFQGLSSVTSAYKLFKTVDKMEYELDISSWKRGLVEFTLPGSESSRSEDRMAAFWYRNPVTCIEFLMKQPAFREHMAYAPRKEYNEVGERMYSEIKSGDWWWRKQVMSSSKLITSLR